MQTAGLIVMGVGIGCLVGCPIALVRTKRFLARARETHGTVVALEESRSTSGNGTAYYPVIHYQTHEGSQHEVTATVGGNPPDFQVGDSVAVLYDPENPETMRLDASLHIWFPSILLGVFGVIFTLMGYGMMNSIDP